MKKTLIFYLLTILFVACSPISPTPTTMEEPVILQAPEAIMPEVMEVATQGIPDAPTFVQVEETLTPTPTFIPDTETPAPTDTATMEIATYDGWLEPRPTSPYWATEYCMTFQEAFPLTPCPTVGP